jgi:L-iditol 2-dehydrogenase
MATVIEQRFPRPNVVPQPSATLRPIPATMQAALFYGPGDIRTEAISVPSVGPGELLVQIEASLTCGTDLKTYRRGHPVLLKSLPSPFGHEFCGRVAQVGDCVSAFTVGQRVVSANSAPCYGCYFCEHQQYNLCERLELLNGAYAEYIRVPAQIVAYNTLVVPETVLPEIAALTEPLAVCLRGIEACRLRPGDQVCIIGTGSIGLMMTKLAKLQGAEVIVVGRNPHKKLLAQSFGHADAVADMSDLDDAKQFVKTHTQGGYGFDVVIEAVGQPHLWEKSIDLVRRGGLVNLFGGCSSSTTVTFETRRLHYDEITLLSLFHHTPRHIRQALELLVSGDFDPQALMTHTLGLHECRKALELMSDGKAIKVALKPS